VTRFVSQQFDKNRHNRELFASGNRDIDDYLARGLTQDIKRNFAKCYVLVERETGKIAGYYTLSSASIPLNCIPQDLAKRLPRYPNAPATLIGRLGRDLGFKGEGVGKMLLFDAIMRVASDQSASYAICAEAIDENAANFYATHGFQPLASDSGTSFFLPMGTALQLIET
jgi:predicted GNAT family N-acyltransferase